MSTEVYNFAQTSVPTGQFNIPERVLPAAVVKLEIKMALCTTATPTIWPNPATKLSIALEVSYDGGATWLGGGGVTGMAGGIQRNKFGQELAFGGFVASFAGGTPGRLRGTLTVTNGPLLTSCSVLVN